MARQPASSSLASLLASQVPQSIRQRGRAYFDRGDVAEVGGDGQRAYALVDGSERYRVALVLEPEGDLTTACSCPYYDSHHDVCKHIWAAILAADGFALLPPRTAHDLWIELDPRLLEAFDDIAANATVAAHQDDTDTPPPAPRRSRESATHAAAPTATPAWQRQLEALILASSPPPASGREVWPASRRLYYIIDAGATLSGAGNVVVQLATRDRRADGGLSKLQPRIVAGSTTLTLPDPEDRRITSLLSGSRDRADPSAYYGYYGSQGSTYELAPPVQRPLIPAMAQTGRLLIRPSDERDPIELAPDNGEPWRFQPVILKDDPGEHYILTGRFTRADQSLPLNEPTLVTAGGLLFTRTHAATLDTGNAFPLLGALRARGPLAVPIAQGRGLMATTLIAAGGLPIEAPDELRLEEARPTPLPRLRVRQTAALDGPQKLLAAVDFRYDAHRIDSEDPRPVFMAGDPERAVYRDADAESRAIDRLYDLGFRDTRWRPESAPEPFELGTRHLPRVVQTLVAEGWEVEAEGDTFRAASGFQMKVASGVDWFDLEGEMRFGEATASLPTLLEAARRGDATVRLDDGSFGILPADWLQRYGLLAGMGEQEGGAIRFRPTQAPLLDALLATMPEVDVDAAFEKARQRLRTFDGVEPADPPPGFSGTLRPYQREGLGWLRFLRSWGVGGCLADDMGLGKTVQVLALLADRGESAGKPSLVVAPRSLMHNWKAEAERFAPGLKVYLHHGNDRFPDRKRKSASHLQGFDLVLTTYGTLRIDAAVLKDASFDYAILDEAQAIKNPTTAVAKAARLLRADHRLALSGTPVENHLGDLFSIFEFLNPGMLGRSPLLSASGGSGSEGPGMDEAARDLLRRGLKPFILRRTKAQVATDLPEKHEQTIYCDLVGRQRKQYDELRDHYRRSLLGRIDEAGLAKSKIQVLEALLRLRQAACHPGLIDRKREKDSCAKFDELLPRLEELAEEGNKALVFSQFTGLLGILRAKLDAKGVAYEYLDGKTSDRQARVERFQNDPACPLFLISLKAGGVGLNLTAAGYVFLLDPWWNPAVEAQAIDRAHRIGQTRRVFAYRLIARETVEEKVLELQQHKRDLADAIIAADPSLIRSLTRDDLERLLS